MKFRRSSIVLAGTAIALVALAAGTRFFVVPQLTQLPANLDTTVRYEGVATMLNSAAIASGDIANALATNVPTTMDRRGYAVSTHGGVAIIADEVTIQAGTTALPKATHYYAVDRSTLEAAQAIGDQEVEPATGLAIGFPMTPRADDGYRFYDATTQTTTAVDFTGTGTSHGLAVNEYTFTVAGALKDKGLLAGLPPALPSSLVLSMSSILPPALAQQLEQNAATLPQALPLTYTASTTVDISADQITGIAIEQRVKQQVVANIELAGTVTPLMPVLALEMSLTSASQDDLAKDASSAGTTLLLIQTIAPLVLLGLGVLALTVALLRRRPPASSSASQL